MVRPGATRLNLPWFSSEAELELVLGALELVAGQGWRLLPVYRFTLRPASGATTPNSVFRSDTSLLNVSTLGVSNVTNEMSFFTGTGDG